jgi:Rps23 Pro-64 3,4-dihydroxylase Tpa1-like proline 4-hydroxylase
MFNLDKLFAARAQPATPVALDYAALDKLAASRAEAHAKAYPYAHCCIDDFLPLPLVRAIAKEIPRPDGDPKWSHYFAEGFEDKWAISDDLGLPPTLRALIHEMNASYFLRFLEKLTGIDHLLPDPHLHGAGLHLVPSGGVLQVHSDFNYSAKLQLHRRVNAFLYLNPDWQDEWGGALELWDRHDGSAQASYPPRFNRLVVFNARSDTFHGHPAPITSPKTQWRTSIAMYYYTSERPVEEIEAPHNTIYKGLHI